MGEWLATVPEKRLTPAHRDLLRARDTPILRREWDIWMALSARRRAGLSRAESIGFDQIAAWQTVTGRSLAAWQLRALDAVENAWRKVMSGEHHVER